MDPCVQCFCSYGLAAGHIDRTLVGVFNRTMLQHR